LNKLIENLEYYAKKNCDEEDDLYDKDMYETLDITSDRYIIDKYNFSIDTGDSGIDFWIVDKITIDTICKHFTGIYKISLSGTINVDSLPDKITELRIENNWTINNIVFNNIEKLSLIYCKFNGHIEFNCPRLKYLEIHIDSDLLSNVTQLDNMLYFLNQLHNQPKLKYITTHDRDLQVIMDEMFDLDMSKRATYYIDKKLVKSASKK
jgi:hypothetical protein